MLYYKADYYCYDDYEDYDQLEFISDTLLNAFDSAKEISLNIIDDYYEPCFLFYTKELALDQGSYLEGTVSIKITKFDLNEFQMRELILDKQLLSGINPLECWYYTWNVEKQDMEEFKLKAFL